MLVQDFVDEVNDYHRRDVPPLNIIYGIKIISHKYVAQADWLGAALPYYVHVERKTESGCEN